SVNPSMNQSADAAGAYCGRVPRVKREPISSVSMDPAMLGLVKISTVTFGRRGTMVAVWFARQFAASTTSLSDVVNKVGVTAAVPLSVIDWAFVARYVMPPVRFAVTSLTMSASLLTNFVDDATSSPARVSALVEL